MTTQALDAGFFNASGFPTATFTAQITAEGDGYLADGTLTIKDITMQVALPFTLDLDGNAARMVGQLAIDRRSFEVGQSMSDETNLAFAVDVDISLSAARGQ
ncbi:MAG: polyisoprenoid-binding protein YceI [Yoonia sp.]